MIKYLTIIAAIITIVAFVTGIFSLPQFFGTHEDVGSEPETAHSPHHTQTVLPRCKITLHGGSGFSFSLGTKTSESSGDIRLFQHYDYNAGGDSISIRLGSHNLVKPLGPVSLESVTECPKVSGWWRDSGNVTIKVGSTYVIALCTEFVVFPGKAQYVLIRVLDIDNSKPGSMSFEYVYQPNGSRYFNIANNDAGG